MLHGREYNQSIKGSVCYTPKHLSSCVQELTAIIGELDRARVGLQERDFLIVAHERSEDALAGHALDLTAKLDVACADVKTLSNR